MLQFKREPRIEKCDLDLVKELLGAFDYVAINSRGEHLGRLKAAIPGIGKVVISYLPIEDHVAVFRDTGNELSTSDKIWSGELDQLIDKTKDAFIAFVRKKLAQEVCPGAVAATLESRMAQALKNNLAILDILINKGHVPLGDLRAIVHAIRQETGVMP